MEINKTEVKKIANLAGLNIDEKDIDSSRKALVKILSLFDNLKRVKTAGIEPMHNTISEPLHLHADKIDFQNSKEDILANTVYAKFGFYTVPKIIE